MIRARMDGKIITALASTVWIFNSKIEMVTRVRFLVELNPKVMKIGVHTFPA